MGEAQKDEAVIWTLIVDTSWWDFEDTSRWDFEDFVMMQDVETFMLAKPLPSLPMGPVRTLGD